MKKMAISFTFVNVNTGEVEKQTRLMKSPQRYLRSAMLSGRWTDYEYTTRSLYDYLWETIAERNHINRYCDLYALEEYARLTNRIADILRYAGVKNIVDVKED